ncbi:MAG: DUF1292 domain-containing protein [Lachnospiraceae bacterium]|nr:DUF1292 domain-containing protein [Lachnospiraceae bacterium]
MSKEYDEMELDTITLTLDDDTELECGVLATFPVDGKQYIAVVPVDENGEFAEDAELYFYQFEDLGNDELNLIAIESDEEFEAVADAFDELLDEEEFEEAEAEDEE